MQCNKRDQNLRWHYTKIVHYTFDSNDFQDEAAMIALSGAQ